MKKRTVVLIALLILTLVIEACNTVSHGKEGSVSTPSTPIRQETLPSAGTALTDNTKAAAPSEEVIGETAALSIALSHSGTAQGDVLFSQTKLDFDDGRQIYEVEFYAGNKEYDYEIDAFSGNILSFDTDMEMELPINTQPSKEQAPQNNTPVQEQAASNNAHVQPSGNITLEAAKALALSKVPGASAEHIRIKEDYDDGRLQYEGKIIYQETEYEFEIDASSGNITDWDQESIYD